MKFHLPENHRILVIDDKQPIHDDFRKILVIPSKLSDDLAKDEAALFGEPPIEHPSQVFEIASAYEGREGLEMIGKSLLEGRPFALAFVDVRMPPGWDGVETTCKIWENFHDLQIVLCTAFADRFLEEKLQKLGHSERMVILKKPFSGVEVLQLAVAMTEQWRVNQLAKLRLDDLAKLIQRLRSW
jgi:CheY-like chemotaxis protein